MANHKKVQRNKKRETFSYRLKKDCCKQRVQWRKLKFLIG